MLRKWKKYGCILFLLIALPYVITILSMVRPVSQLPNRRKRKYRYKAAETTG